MLHAPYRFVLFGSFTIEDRHGQRQTRFRTRRAAALAAFLALRIGQGPLRRAELADQFWPDLTEAGQRNSLSIALSALRSILEPAAVAAPGVVLTADRSTVLLRPESVTVDVSRFDHLIARVQSSGLRRTAGSPGRTVDEAADAAESLREAVSLYRGSLLSGMDDNAFHSERERRAAQFSWAVQTLCQHLAASATSEEAVTIARLGVEREPGRDELQAELVRRLLAAGERSEARHHYTLLSQMLDSLGEDPPSDLADALAASPAIRSIRTLRAVPTAASTSLEPAAPLPAPFLPSAPTPFIGRNRERRELASLLRRDTGSPAGSLVSRLVTITGPGGMGKTRLALEAAREAAVSRTAVFVSLAAVTAPEQIAPTLSACLASHARKAAGEPRAEETILSSPADLEQAAHLLREVCLPGVLLVLDNVEQVAAGAANVIQFLLDAVPGLTILATSRLVLGLAAETTFPLGPLSLPTDKTDLEQDTDDSGDGGDGSDALCLFVRRVQAIRPEFRVAPRNAAAVISLVHRLEGIPLALELAGAQAGSLSPARMLERLERRLDFLAMRDGRRGLIGIADRHRSLRAAIAGSADLLAPAAARFWSSLSAFRGGFTAEAAAAVAGTDAAASEETLEALRQASLVTVTEDPNDPGEMRFTLLETLREYAEELSEDHDHGRDGPKERHAAYFLALAERAAPLLYGPEQHQWLGRLRSDHVNLHTALDHLTASGKSEEALRMASALQQYWRATGGISDAQVWCQSPIVQGFLRDPTVPPGVRGRAFGALATVAGTWTHHAAAVPDFREAIALLRTAGDREGLAHILSMQFGEPTLLEEGATLAEEMGLHHARFVAHLNLGINAWHAGDDTTAEVRFARSLDAAILGGSSIDELGVRSEWAYFLSCRCRYERAESLLKEAIEKYERSASACRLVSHARWLLGNVYLCRKEYAAALTLTERSLAERRGGSRHALCDTLRTVATVRLYAGDRTGALLALEESRQIGLALGSSYAAYADTLLARFALDEGDSPAARARLSAVMSGGSLEEDLWGTAAAEREAGRLALLDGTEAGPPWSPAAAREALPRVARSVRLRRDMGLPRLALESLETFAGVLAAWGTPDAAQDGILLLSRCRRERLRLQAPLPPPDEAFVSVIAAVAASAVPEATGPDATEPDSVFWDSLTDQALALARRLSDD